MRRLPFAVFCAVLAAASLVANPAAAQESWSPNSSPSSRSADEAPADSVKTQASGAVPIRRTATITSLSPPPTGHPAGKTLTKAAVTVDLAAGTVNVAATLAGATQPSDNSSVEVVLGQWNRLKSSCQARFVIGLHTANSAAGSQIFGPPIVNIPVITWQRPNGSNTITVKTAAHSAIRSSTWDCVFADTYPLPAVPGQDPYQSSLAANLPVTAYRMFPVASIKVAGKDERRLKPGTWSKVKVKVANTGRASGTFTLKSAGSKLAFKPKKIKMGAIAAGKAKTEKVKVKLAKGLNAKAKFTASTGGSSASDQVTIYRKIKPGKPKSLSGNYYWGADVADDTAWANRSVWFVNSKWAYVGLPKSGRPTCKKTTKTCKRYSYSRGSGKVKIGSLKGTVTDKGLTLTENKRKVWYQALSVSRAGTKFNVDLRHQGATGNCGFSYVSNCYTWTETLILAKDRRFIKTRSSISSSNPLGTIIGYVAADQKGTYQVLSKGRIRFKYANGKTETKTIGVKLNPVFKPSPSLEGLIVGNTSFY